MTYLTRRNALAAVGTVAAEAAPSGCTIPISAFCPADPSISDPNTPLTIDAHVHVFNGSDLQIGGFFTNILAVNYPSLRGLAPILEALGDFAPTANDEISELQKLSGILQTCESSAQLLESYRESGYQKAALALKSAVRRARSGAKAQSVSPEAARLIEVLPETLAEYQAWRRRTLRLSPSPETITVLGGIHFLICNLQFRYINAHNYLLEYSKGKERKVDLIVAHLVDFDWPIASGKPTSSPLADQIRVMEQITRPTNGRVQCFAPFDPMKEVAYSLDLSETSSLGLVKDAVLNHGFIGVKLYPPMGFAPLGNAKLGTTFWNQRWLASAFHRSDMGNRLDDALD